MKLAALGVSLAVFASPAFAVEASCGSAPLGKATGEPIAIGGIDGKTGPTDFSSAGRGAAAYFACVNAHGGVGGRPIVYSLADDQWSPEVALQQATSLINDKKVLALAGSLSVVGCQAYANSLKTADVMDVGLGADRACFNNPNILSVTPGPRRNLVALAQYAKAKYGAKTLAVAVMHVPGNEWTSSGVVDWGKANGVEIKLTPFDPQTGDPTAFALQVAATKADAFLFALPKNLSVAVLNAAEQQDMAKSMHFLSSTAIYGPEVPKALGEYWDGKLDVALELGAVEATDKDTANWHAVMDAYGAPSDPRDTFSQGGYLDAAIVTAALRKLDPKRIDRAALSDALRHTSGFANAMLCEPYTVRDPKADAHADNRQLLMAGISGGAWKVIEGCKAAPFVGE